MFVDKRVVLRIFQIVNDLHSIFVWVPNCFPNFKTYQYCHTSLTNGTSGLCNLKSDTRSPSFHFGHIRAFPKASNTQCQTEGADAELKTVKALAALFLGGSCDICCTRTSTDCLLRNFIFCESHHNLSASTF